MTSAEGTMESSTNIEYGCKCKKYEHDLRKDMRIQMCRTRRKEMLTVAFVSGPPDRWDFLAGVRVPGN